MKVRRKGGPKPRVTFPQASDGRSNEERKKPELVVFVGLPASGKSTFYADQFSETHTIVSKDLMKKGRRPKEERQNEQVKSLLQKGRSVVVDNTSPSRASRHRLLQIASEMGAKKTAYHLLSDVRESLERNRKRAQSVPDIAIFSAASKLEPPVYEEGFDDIFEVRIKKTKENPDATQEKTTRDKTRGPQEKTD